MKWPSMPLLLQDQSPQENVVEAWTHYQICTACPAHRLQTALYAQIELRSVPPAHATGHADNNCVLLIRLHFLRTSDCATSHLTPSTASGSRRPSARFRAGGRCKYDQTIAMKEKAFAGPPCRARGVPSR